MSNVFLNIFSKMKLCGRPVGRKFFMLRRSALAEIT